MKTGARLPAGPRPYCVRRLLLLTGAGSLGRPEGNPSPHGLLLNGRRGTPELLRDLAGRGSRFRERLQGLQLTGAPGSAIVRGTFRHYSILQKTPNYRVGVESYTLLRKKARPTSPPAVKRHVVGSGQLVEGGASAWARVWRFRPAFPRGSRTRSAVTFATLQPRGVRPSWARTFRERHGRMPSLTFGSERSTKPRLGASGAAGERAPRGQLLSPNGASFELLPGADP